MNQLEAFLEQTWNNILSRDPQKIVKTYKALDTANQRIVFDHLKKMVSESGWQVEQIKSAQAALQAIQSDSEPKQ